MKIKYLKRTNLKQAISYLEEQDERVASAVASFLWWRMADVYPEAESLKRFICYDVENLEPDDLIDELVKFGWDKSHVVSVCLSKSILLDAKN